MEFKPWARRNGQAVFIDHDASRTSNDCYVCEIESGSKFNEQRQLYEEMIMIPEGRGSTIALADQGLEAKMNKAMTHVGYFYLKIKMVEL